MFAAHACSQISEVVGRLVAIFSIVGAGFGKFVALLQGLVPKLRTELRALLLFYPQECLAGRVAIVFARELGDDFTVAGHGLLFGDIIIGRSPFVAVREIQ
jgi:hypothetical protein